MSGEDGILDGHIFTGGNDGVVCEWDWKSNMVVNEKKLDKRITAIQQWNKTLILTQGNDVALKEGDDWKILKTREK